MLLFELLSLCRPSLCTNFYKFLYFVEYCVNIKSCVVVSFLGSLECKPKTLRDEADIDTFCLAQRNVRVSVNAHCVIYICNIIYIHKYHLHSRKGICSVFLKLHGKEFS